jgi:predicted nucleotidyltransferase
MKDLINIAADLQSFAEENGWKFHFIGGIVVLFWGRPRLTADIDITVYTDLINEEDYIAKLLSKYRAKVTNIEEFALKMRVMPLETSDGVGIDVIFGGISDPNSQLERSTYRRFTDTIELKVCSAEDLIILKTIAWRPQDVYDIEGIVIKQSELDWAYTIEQLEIVGEYENIAANIQGLLDLKEKHYKK